MPNAVTYCRVSSDEQAAKDLSIPAQRKALERWAAEQPDLTIVGRFEDQGESAYAPADRRPGFCEMIRVCRRQDVDLILVHKLDRFSRNREESILFKSLLRRHGVTVRSITERFDPSTPQGFLYEGMIEVINQFYSMNLATETLKGMRENAERGHFNGGKPPFGYVVEAVHPSAERSPKRLIPGPPGEVEQVREIFRLVAEQGLGVGRLAQRLNTQGFRSPTGRRWCPASLHFILTNRTYLGETVWGKSRKVGRHERASTERGDWIVVPDTHEPLVDRELFERAQAQLRSRRFETGPREVKSESYLLSGLIRCGHCGEVFVGRRYGARNKAGRKVWYYNYYCAGYRSGGKAVCPSLPLKRDWLDGIVLDAVQARLATPRALAALEADVLGRIEAREQTYGLDGEQTRRQIEDIDRRIANFYRAIGAGLDPLLCQQNVAELQGERARVEAEAALAREADHYRDAQRRSALWLEGLATDFAQRFGALPFATRRRVVMHLVDRIEVVERRWVDVYLRTPEGGEPALRAELAAWGLDLVSP
ncbi:MAG: recombinase family protein [Alphaproteobacteria bacterium]|nr:recombinase family protein [Alphaproteobacteria bacterium]